MISRSRIFKLNAKLTTYGGNSLNVLGKCSVLCKISEGNVVNFKLNLKVEFQVVDAVALAALGLPTIKSLNFIRKIEGISDEEN